YLTGFTGSAAMLLVRPDDLVFVTDGRYRDQATDQLAAASVIADIGIGLGERQREIVGAAAGDVARLGLEAHAVSWAQQRELVATEGVVEEMRKRKDDGELARMAAAAAIADDALASVLPLVVGGAAERDIAIELDFAMRRGGASGPSFETIVAAGPNGAKPHARPSTRPIGPGEMVVIDFGAVVDGYCSDMTRTVCVGEPADPTAARMAE